MPKLSGKINPTLRKRCAYLQEKRTGGKKVKKRLLRVTGIFLAMSMLTVRCNASGGDDGEESASNEKVTLTIEASQEIMNNIPYAEYVYTPDKVGIRTAVRSYLL